MEVSSKNSEDGVSIEYSLEQEDDRDGVESPGFFSPWPELVLLERIDTSMRIAAPMALMGVILQTWETKRGDGGDKAYLWHLFTANAV